MIPNICNLSQVNNGFNISHDYKSIIHHMIRMAKKIDHIIQLDIISHKMIVRRPYHRDYHGIQ